MMEEKLYNLIQERGPWLLKKNLVSKSIFSFLKNYLKFEETIFVISSKEDIFIPLENLIKIEFYV